MWILIWHSSVIASVYCWRRPIITVWLMYITSSYFLSSQNHYWKWVFVLFLFSSPKSEYRWIVWWNYPMVHFVGLKGVWNNSAGVYTWLVVVVGFQCAEYLSVQSTIQSVTSESNYTKYNNAIHIVISILSMLSRKFEPIQWQSNILRLKWDEGTVIWNGTKLGDTSKEWNWFKLPVKV